MQNELEKLAEILKTAILMTLSCDNDKKGLDISQNPSIHSITGGNND